MADSPYFKEQKNIEKPKMIFFFFFFFKNLGDIAFIKLFGAPQKSVEIKI